MGGRRTLRFKAKRIDAWLERSSEIVLVSGPMARRESTCAAGRSRRSWRAPIQTSGNTGCAYRRGMHRAQETVTKEDHRMTRARKRKRA